MQLPHQRPWLVGVVWDYNFNPFPPQVKTSKVFIRDSTLIHPLTLLLFAGRSLEVIGEGVCVWCVTKCMRVFIDSW